VLWATTFPAYAATIFESGTLGPTGISREDIASIGGSNVSASVFVGVRFFVDQPAIATGVGGHFIKNTGADESFFGAIVAIDDQHDFPDSGDLSTPDVVDSVLLRFPEFSNEVSEPLTTRLMPGWYALVFGSGLFGATGKGVALSNNPDFGTPTYIAYQPGAGWFKLGGFFSDFRFTVDGQVVPEPATIAIIGSAFFCLLFRKVL
jgi:hypothetical protein